jgi:acyl-CoA thioesterase-2
VVDRLVALLDLERIENDIFRGVSPSDSPARVFGGQVAAQALVAAGRTVPVERSVHSLHAYFFRPGDPRVPIVYNVDRIRDGQSFTTRRVVAIQHGRAIFTLAASFQLPEQGLEHADEMPEVPAPEQLDDLASWARRSGDSRPLLTQLPRPFDLRYITPPPGLASEPRLAPARATRCGYEPTATCPTMPFSMSVCWPTPPI